MYKSLALTALGAAQALATASLNVYWGQSTGLRLSEYCEAGNFDYVTIAFVNYSPENTASGYYPGDNFAGNCGVATYTTATGESTQLLSGCTQIAEDIPACQELGIKVILSIGGAVGYGEYSISSPAAGESFAQFMWDAFGPYNADSGSVRPFDQADGTHVSVDGFDFDIEYYFEDQTGYVAMINRLRALFAGGDYIITGAPQCPLTGNQDMGYMIQNAKFDLLFIQYYNNQQCDGLSGNFLANYILWENSISLGASAEAKLFVGLIATPVGSTGYLEPAQAANVLSQVSTRSSFGGAMLWDAVSATNKTSYGITYNDYIWDVVNGRTPTSTTIASTTTTASASPTATVCTQFYTVVSGDTCWDISQTYGISLAEFQEINGLDATCAIYPGSLYCVETGPAPKTATTTTSSSTSTSSSSSSSVSSTTSAASATSFTSSASISSTGSTSSISSTSTSSLNTTSSSTSTVFSSISATSSSSSSSSSSEATSLISNSTTSSVSSSQSTNPVSSTSSSYINATSSASTISTSMSSMSASSSSYSNATSSSRFISSTASSLPSSSSSFTNATSYTPSISSTASSLPASSFTSSSSITNATSSASNAPSSSSWSSSASFHFTNSSTNSRAPSTTHLNPASSTRASLTSSSSVSSLPVESSSTGAASSFGISATSLPTSWTTSTIFSTKTYTVTSCAPTVTDCPARIGQVTTEIIPVYITVCPVTATETPAPTQWTISTIYSTKTYTIASCAATITNCSARVGQVTTEIIPVTTTYCPVAEAETSAVENGAVPSSGSVGAGSGEEITTTQSITSTLVTTIKVAKASSSSTYAAESGEEITTTQSITTTLVTTIGLAKASSSSTFAHFSPSVSAKPYNSTLAGTGYSVKPTPTLSTTGGAAAATSGLQVVTAGAGRTVSFAFFPAVIAAVAFFAL